MIKDFEYFTPGTVKEALALLSRFGEESKMIAGGQSMLILMKQGLVSPQYLIDLKGISALDYIRFNKKEGLKIGSLTTHRSIETSQVIRSKFGVLAEMEQNVASVETRNWGTIGGNICHADPAGDPAPVFISLKTELTIANLAGERTMAAEDFFKDYFETALQADEILTGIRVPSPLPRTGTVYRKFSLLEGDFALVSAAVSITLSPGNDTCTDARIVLGAAGPIPIRARQAEKALVGREISDNVLEAASEAASAEARPISDMHASEEYRREVIRTLVKRIAGEACKRAKLG